jgi:hypothetical protein
VALGAAGQASDRWAQFKQRGAGNDASRFESAAGSGRYQIWESAIDAYRAHPLEGIGPGTYEYWWAQNGSLATFVRDAHSLPIETLAELGPVGFLLIVGFITGILVVGVGRSRQVGEARPWLVACCAASAAFAAAASIDWVWEVAVIPVVFLLLAAAILGFGADSDGSRSMFVTRAAMALGALAAIGAIAIPLAGASALRESQAEARSGNLRGALTDAREAAEIQPFAASAVLQQALVLERQGRLEAAAAAVRDATQIEASNWRNWLVLSRIDAFLGRTQGAIRAYRKARSLNPRSELFRRRPS